MKNINHMATLSKYTGSLVVLFLLLFTGCKEKDEVISGFQINQNEFVFDEFGSTVSLEIKTAQAWNAAANAEWCLISPANGLGSGVCKIAVDTSYLYDSREAVITFYSGNVEHKVNLRQFGFKKEIFVKEKPMQLPHFEFKGKNKFELEVFSNVNFELQIAEEDKQWLNAESFNFDAISIPRGQKVIFTYDSNNAFEGRTAKVLFKATGENAETVAPVEVEIAQDAAPFIPKNTRAGDSMALLTIGRQLNLYIQYDPSKNMDSWPDVSLKEVTYKNEQGESVTDMRVTGVRFFMFETDETLPFEITYLTELRTLIALGNANGSTKRIKLGPEISELKKLKELALFGYGVHELCPELTRLDELESLVLHSNTLLEIPYEIFAGLKNLELLDIGGNTPWLGISDLSNNLEKEIGLTGPFPVDLVRKSKMKKLKSLAIYHNYFEGSVPELPDHEVIEFESLAINGNKFSGELPQWILNHPNLPCWDPYVFIFSQYGKDSAGNLAYFTNEPARVVGECSLWDNENSDGNIDYNPDWNIPNKYNLTKDQVKYGLSLSLTGNWKL